MSGPWADLTWDGTFGTGRLRNHPCEDIEVRALVIAPTEMTVGLWDVGKHFIGNGLLRLADGIWRGTVSEFGGVWIVTCSQGSNRLVFNEET